MNAELLERDRVHAIVGAFYTVYNYFGFGLVESVYAGALECELVGAGHAVAREIACSVSYKGYHVAWQRLDMVVDDRVIVELKSTEKLPPYTQRQLISYLTATHFQVGVLLHFGPEPKFHRFVNSQRRSFAVIREELRSLRSSGSPIISEQPRQLPTSDAPV